SPIDAAALIPRHAAFLRMAFPVLTRVESIGRTPDPVRPVRDPQERRQRAFASLRELVSRIAEQRTVVMLVDDLQWGDLDSMHLLREILRPPDPPPLLLVAASRPERAAEALVASLGERVERIDLDVLDDSSAFSLARQLLAAAGLVEVAPLAIVQE